jgi:hypothetical protein
MAVTAPEVSVLTPQQAGAFYLNALVAQSVFLLSGVRSSARQGVALHPARH